MKKTKFLSLLLLGLLCSVGNAWGGTSITWTPTEANVTKLNAETDNLITVGSGKNSYIVAATGRLCGTGTGLTWSSTCIQLSNNKLNRGGVAIYFPSGVNDVESITFYLHTNTSRKTYYYSGEALSSSNKPDGTQTTSALAQSSTGYTFDWDTPNTSKTYAVGGYTGGSGNAYLDKIVVVFVNATAPDDPTFDPESGSSLSEGTEITLTATGATTIKYQWSSSAIDAEGDWDGAATYGDEDKPVVPDYGSTNNVLSVKATNTFGSTYGFATYTISQPQVATPSISPADGSSFSGASQEITLACATNDATIYYTLDGSTPTDESTEYTGAFSISSTTTIKAIAVKGGYVNSDVASATIKKVIPGTWGSWDFTNWSPATISGTGSDSEKWYDHEKSGGTGVDFTDGKGAVNKTAISTAAVIKYGTTEIEETKDLRFTADAYQFALVYNVPSALNIYHGSQYIWLFKSSSVITIPSVPANAIIEIATETHKNTAARYVTLKNGSTSLTMTQGAIEGDAALEYQVCKWTNISTAGDVTITPSAGLHIYYITVTANVETVPVTKRNDRTYGTFVAPSGLDFSEVPNMEAYIAKAINGTTSVSISKVKKVPAGTAFIVKTANPTVDLANVPVTTSATASDVEGNLLVAGNGATANSDYYYLAGDQFHLAIEGTLQAGKAYLPAGAVGAPGLLRIVEGEQNATNIEDIESADKAVKFIENGRILILRDGITYDALGRIVK